MNPCRIKLFVDSDLNTHSGSILHVVCFTSSSKMDVNHIVTHIKVKTFAMDMMQVECHPQQKCR